MRKIDIGKASREELIDYPNIEYCGVATFTEQAAKANTTLFI